MSKGVYTIRYNCPYRLFSRRVLVFPYLVLVLLFLKVNLLKISRIAETACYDLLEKRLSEREEWDHAVQDFLASTQIILEYPLDTDGNTFLHRIINSIWDFVRKWS